MTEPLDNAAAIVGVGAILPDAPDAQTFWENVTTGRYSITEVGSDRWDPALYYDPDPQAPEKTYSKLGGWVRDWEWEPLAWKLPIPPKVSDGMDDAHKWALACTRMALADAGWPEKPLDFDRTAVIVGNAMSGEKHYLTALRITFPELARELGRTDSFSSLPAEVRERIERELRGRFEGWLPPVSEDTMPGELGNCIAGRVANLFNMHGPNFTTDAACASALAAMDATFDGLMAHEFDVAITGGIDRNMSPHTFVKFCAIGALSPSGTRPYDGKADGFIMGEGGALFVVKRLADAVRDEDRIYAVVRGIGSSSDGKGKGITAPNPIGQKFAIARAWENAGISPSRCTLIEGHGTSTRVGDSVEVTSLMDAFGSDHLEPGSIALGSVKSNIGHLKAAAGAAGMLKAALALHEKVLPPSLNFEDPNPEFDWSASPFAVNTELREWTVAADQTRLAGVSAFGFGGTNFHVVLEEYAPGRQANGNGHRAHMSVPAGVPKRPAASAGAGDAKAPLRGALVLGAGTPVELANELRTALAEARQGRHLEPIAPTEAALRAPERLAIDYADGPDLVAKAELALKLLSSGGESGWPALRGRGIHRGSGAPGKVAFLFTGQGSQYANMLGDLREREPAVAELFDEADEIMRPLLEGRSLSEIVFANPEAPEAMARAEEALRPTEIQQPAVITVDTALARLLAEYGITPDMVMGHSVGEYGALVASGGLTFHDALEAVSARGREMAHLRVEDPGAMVAALAPREEVQELVDAIDGYVVLANINSNNQVVIGGATDAVAAAEAELQKRGHTAIRLPVSHAFHTEIVAPASVPLRAMLERLGLREPALPTVANVTGELYPTGAGAREQMLDMLSRQVASPVQFVKGLRTLYDAGARVFVEVGPKHALQGFTADVFGEQVVSLATNHPKQGGVATFNNALCGLWAAGLGRGREAAARAEAVYAPPVNVGAAAAAPASAAAAGAPPAPPAVPHGASEVERLLAEFVERGRRLLGASGPASGNGRGPEIEPVVITGAGVGLPGREKLFDESNIAALLGGEQGIDVIPAALRREMLGKHITRLVKGDDGTAKFETIDRLEDVIKLAARAGSFDLGEEFGVDAERIAALGRHTQLAIAAGIDALRDAGIPLVLRYKTATTGARLPDRWSLPQQLRDDTGVIFASAFPGLEEMADEVQRFTTDRMRRERMAALQSLRARMLDHESTDPVVLAEVERRIEDLRHQLESEPYDFNRRFIFRVLSMGHAQFAELIGARGPNTQINSACASTTQAVGLAEDWIRAGRCRRVVIIAADDATSSTLMPWIGSGFLATGAAATDEVVEEAALPFDRRRHGMVVGMGAAGLVVESAEAARERGITPICEVLGSVTANSAFHGTRLDIDHICAVMESVVEEAEARGVRRSEIAQQLVFISHETYTPARGGSAAAEIHALRRVFGDDAGRIVIANVKGYTGHPMAVGLEDVLAVKSLETGIVPPVPNFREPDPELGVLNLSNGGSYPIHYALRLAAGFGSQIAMTLLRWTPALDGRRRAPRELGFEYRVADRDTWKRWLTQVSRYPEPVLEVVQHRLRVADQGAPAEQAEPSLPISRTRSAMPVSTPAPAAVPLAPAASAAPAAAAASAAPGVEPAPAAPAPANGDGVAAKVLEIVATQTGYPPELLDMDLDLEADLGIDTVKQAEVIAAIRETYGIARDDALKLRDYPTLNHVVGFVNERAGSAAPAAVTAPQPPAPPTSAEPEQPAAPPAGQPAAPASTDADAVAAKVLEIVAAQTGYPPELLDMDLDLEADLGIDTVKQAEVIAAIRETYGIARDDALKLRDYPTLNHVVGFVNERAGLAAPDLPVEEPEPEVAASEADGERFPRRVPVPVLRPPLDYCVPTGVTLGRRWRVVLMPDAGGAAAALTASLEERGVEVLAIEGSPTVAELEQRLTGWLATDGIDGVYWLAALDDDGALEDAAVRESALHVRVKLLAAAMRTVPETAFLVAGTRLGGCHGYGAAGSEGVLGGALTGFTKALSLERPDTLCKAVDFARGADAGTVAQTLLDETLSDPGAVEIGYADDLRWSVGLLDAAAEHDPARELAPGSVVVVTGAAGSIVQAVLADLAPHAPGAIFHLLDLVAAPDPHDPDLELFSKDPEALKRQVGDRLAERGERVTPKLIERELSLIERGRAALETIRAIELAGGQAHWHQLDLTDAAAVAQTVSEVLGADGRIDCILHCAGLDISHPLPDKPQAEFDRVFDVKAGGWLNLLAALDGAGRAAGTAIVFSSIAGRFGNRGQTDYAAANDLLCKSVASLNRDGRTRAIALDWTAWSEIGMASRGSIPKVMAAAGIEMLPPTIGAAVVRRELTAAGAGGEVVVAGSLGVLLSDRHETGGLDLERVNAALAERPAPMTGRITGFTAGGVLSVLTELDPGRQAFLGDHRIDGIPVLPGVMGIEGFAEISSLLLPGFAAVELDDVELLAPFKFYRDEPRVAMLDARLRCGERGGELVADCELIGRRTLSGQPEQETRHFAGQVRLARRSPAAPKAPAPAIPDGDAGVARPDVYSVYFHGPAYQVLDRAWRQDEEIVGLLASKLPADHDPADAPLALSPRLIELCFQTAGVWELGTTGKMGLPMHLDRLLLFRNGKRTGRLRAVVKPREGAVDAEIVDDSGRVWLRLEGYRTSQVPGELPAAALEPIRSAMADDRAAGKR